MSAKPDSPDLGQSYLLSESRIIQWQRLLIDAEMLVERGDQDEDRVASAKLLLDNMEPLERYWAFPGKESIQRLRSNLARHAYGEFRREVIVITRALSRGDYRYRLTSAILRSDPDERWHAQLDEEAPGQRTGLKPYFEVLIVDPHDENDLREGLRHMRRADDEFVYDCVTVPSFEEALFAVLVNFNIQAILVHHHLESHSTNPPLMWHHIAGLVDHDLEAATHHSELSSYLGLIIAKLRPEINRYLLADASVSAKSALEGFFDRPFYLQDDYTDLHLTLLRGIEERYDKPFFNALRTHAKKPTEVFHALPISRGASVTKSNWIHDIVDFYGKNIFLAETSATTGGLDSLLSPSGPLKRAQELAAKTFGADATFFVTNGTSTANKIVLQALLKPGDVVLVDRDCHKSHHYGFVLSGAQVCYLEPYPLPAFSLYGAVPMAEILRQLMRYKVAGQLGLVRMISLTNCTFDGVVYNVERITHACLSIKPDLVFLWDEAWFAFAGFHPTYRKRTAMYVAEKLRRRYSSPAYREEYESWCRRFPDAGERDEERLAGRGLPDPGMVRIRVYSTQSTHKTLTAFRQGSMIHVHDQDFEGRVAAAFHEARMTHTSTSPNYQLLASLDLGRCQMALEGFELVQKQVARALSLRNDACRFPGFRPYFRFLAVEDLIPVAYRESGISSYFSSDCGWSRMDEAWERDEFVLDLTRLTLFIGKTGMDGHSFRNEILMNRYQIQINKTSANTVLFMTHIGTSRSAVFDLFRALNHFGEEMKIKEAQLHPVQIEQRDRRIESLIYESPELPPFSGFHSAFRRADAGDAADGDIRAAFFRGYDENNCCYRKIQDLRENALDSEVNEWVSSMFVIPYPPGFPVLVPGQVVTPQIVRYILRLDVKEIHGYNPELGLRLFNQQGLTGQ